MFILPILGLELPQSQLRTFTALRTIRLIRVAKAVRFQPRFREMWEIVNSFASSFTTVGWTLLIVFAIVFCFSVLGVKIFGQMKSYHQDWHDKAFTSGYFGNVGDAMLTMFQILTLDLYADHIVRRLTV